MLKYLVEGALLEQQVHISVEMLISSADGIIHIILETSPVGKESLWNIRISHSKTGHSNVKYAFHYGVARMTCMHSISNQTTPPPLRSSSIYYKEMARLGKSKPRGASYYMPGISHTKEW